MTEDEFNSKVKESAQQTAAFDEAIKLMRKSRNLSRQKKNTKKNSKNMQSRREPMWMLM